MWYFRAFIQCFSGFLQLYELFAFHVLTSKAASPLERSEAMEQAEGEDRWENAERSCGQCLSATPLR